MRIVLKKRAVAAFTMVEIAISLGVIAIALVAILGVLPTGVRVQRDNREDTILNQEGEFWLETIRSGSRGLDYLTNYVDLITISNTSALIAFPSPAFSTRVPAGFTTGDVLTNGQQIVGLLTLPKYLQRPGSDQYATNYVTALVRAITGSAVEKSASARDMAFSYRMTSEVVPMNVYPTDSTNFIKAIEKKLPLTDVLIRSNLWRMARNEARNFYEMRLSLQGPVISKGKGFDVLGTPKTFRTLISGRSVQTGAATFIVQPSSFIQVP
jgi:type II secretory pathway pseudopilin PulG